MVKTYYSDRMSGQKIPSENYKFYLTSRYKKIYFDFAVDFYRMKLIK